MKLQAQAVLRRLDQQAPLRLAGVLIAGSFYPLTAQDAWGPLHLEVGLVALAPLTPVVAPDAVTAADRAMSEAVALWRTAEPTADAQLAWVPIDRVRTVPVDQDIRGLIVQMTIANEERSEETPSTPPYHRAARELERLAGPGLRGDQHGGARGGRCGPPHDGWPSRDPRGRRAMTPRDGARSDPARLFLYPMSDLAFRRTVETSFATLDTRSIRDERVLAAVEALLRPSYPLATVVARPDSLGVRGPRAWDAFRDDTALDDELLRRARAGVAGAVRQLHDRYGALAFGVAVCAHGTPSGRPGSPRGYERGGVLGGDATGTDAVDDAVAHAFRVVLAEDGGPLTVKVRVARIAWQVARAAAAETRHPVAAGIVATFLDRHGLTAAEIADVLDLPAGEVARLLAEGGRPPIIP